LALVLPWLLFFALLIWGTTGESPLYWSQRVGRNNTLFFMPKLRSMSRNTPPMASHLMVNPDLYLTPIGSFLRHTSIDELPQLWSVLKGDMSLVGPRPVLASQEDLVALREQEGIPVLTPGITGWAQINGRDILSVQEKVRFDKEYLLRRSLTFDLYILAKTFIVVARREGLLH
jgi:O-antigen biosynthesis protein WbqP